MPRTFKNRTRKSRGGKTYKGGNPTTLRNETNRELRKLVGSDEEFQKVKAILKKYQSNLNAQNATARQRRALMGSIKSLRKPEPNDEKLIERFEKLVKNGKIILKT